MVAALGRSPLYTDAQCAVVRVPYRVCVHLLPADGRLSYFQFGITVNTVSTECFKTNLFVNECFHFSDLESLGYRGGV